MYFVGKWVRRSEMIFMWFSMQINTERDVNSGEQMDRRYHENEVVFNLYCILFLTQSIKLVNKYYWLPI